MTKDKERREETAKITFWVYDIPSNQWNCYFKTEMNPNDENLLNPVPKPRYAHQLVFDNINKVHYLFGGNPGSAELPLMRLNDFWSLRVSECN